MYTNNKTHNAINKHSIGFREINTNRFNTFRNNKLISCGIIMYKNIDFQNYYLCVHPGGPYFKNKDQNCWSIPKGVIENNESLKETACREFTEETGIYLTQDNKNQLLYIGAVRQKGGKIVHAWVIADPNPDTERIYKSNSFTMEYPKNSGTIVEFPEVDKVEYFISQEAKDKLNPAQSDFIKRWETILKNKLNY